MVVLLMRAHDVRPALRANANAWIPGELRPGIVPISGEAVIAQMVAVAVAQICQLAPSLEEQDRMARFRQAAGHDPACRAGSDDDDVMVLRSAGAKRSWRMGRNGLRARRPVRQSMFVADHAPGCSVDIAAIGRIGIDAFLGQDHQIHEPVLLLDRAEKAVLHLGSKVVEGGAEGRCLLGKKIQPRRYGAGLASCISFELGTQILVSSEPGCAGILIGRHDPVDHRQQDIAPG
ncbi:hypothetical protein GCM10010862_10820 [Devosia nitrariae]|uniref:Uncharacterized protein n=1 Tax=Devosia nitrariae TaxID=2071872 RepID=A0ABQ5W1V3_9HYPH|nr:hypothetical protein GCM10010862_10820 [Devosia nitrariae]